MILQQSFKINYDYSVHFTSGLFNNANALLADFFRNRATTNFNQKILFVIDNGVADSHPHLVNNIHQYFEHHRITNLDVYILLVPGGEVAKNNIDFLYEIINAVNTHGIDRHSYLAAIGGGSLLDLAGFAAAISHRGVKHIRIPTTVLSQNDSGVGVKNGINFLAKKNFLGSFAPPLAVFCDDEFLATLSDRDWRSGIAEAIKVALIKDRLFFEWIEAHASQLARRDLASMNKLIIRCAELHLEHIRSGDPFETGSARPLDFGHWSAHKLEQLTNFKVFHGEAVAMGIALDTAYSGLVGYLSPTEVARIVTVLKNVGFEITHPFMEIKDNESPLLQGLQEFREHLGGVLTITLLSAIGKGIEVHEINTGLLKQAAAQIKQLSTVTELR